MIFYMSHPGKCFAPMFARVRGCESRCVCADGNDGAVRAVEEEEEVRDYRVKCLNNLAAAQLKLEQFDKALHTSREVLALEPNNVKALFRVGKVRWRLLRI